MGTDARPLKCPVCAELFGKIPEYDSHFLDHQPSVEMAAEGSSRGPDPRRDGNGSQAAG